jgi:hypothetical protein
VARLVPRKLASSQTAHGLRQNGHFGPSETELMASQQRTQITLGEQAPHLSLL